MFYGQHRKTLDDKDRLVVPAEFRRALEDNQTSVEFFITINPKEGECLSLFPVAVFNELFLQFAAHESYVNEEVQAYKRLVVGRSHRVQCDKQGRIHIPEHLKRDAGLEREVVLVGIYDHAEIWDAARWDRYNEEKRPTIATVARKLHGGRDA